MEAQRDADIKWFVKWLQDTNMDAHTTVFQVSTKDWEALQKMAENPSKKEGE